LGRLGAKSVAEVAGATFGLLVAGPVGAIAGAATIPIVAKGLKNVLGDMAVREMSGREKWQVGTAASHAVNEIYERLVAGDNPKEDGFFQSLKGHRSPAETVLEGVLMTCRLQWEERKVLGSPTFMSMPPSASIIPSRLIMWWCLRSG
jgi:hypothetical protein